MYVSEERFRDSIEIYFLWKKLDEMIKKNSKRGVPLHPEIVEPICCYINKFIMAEDRFSGVDAINPENGDKIQIRATNNLERSYISFGPNTNFDELHFIIIDSFEDKMHFFKFSTEELNDIMVYKDKTFKQVKEERGRVTFDLIKKYIIPSNIEPYHIMDLRDVGGGNYERFGFLL